MKSSKKPHRFATLSVQEGEEEMETLEQLSAHEDVVEVVTVAAVMVAEVERIPAIMVVEMVEERIQTIDDGTDHAFKDCPFAKVAKEAAIKARQEDEAQKQPNNRNGRANLAFRTNRGVLDDGSS